MLLKEVRQKQDEYKASLQHHTQTVDDHAVISECLKNFVEDEWADLWIKITRNNLFAMEQQQEEVEEEEKDELAQQRAAHLATYGGATEVEEIKEEDVTNALKSVRYVFGMLDHGDFTLFKDLHMKVKIMGFKRRDIDFVDMGTCLMNEEKSEKFYFIKMIHNNAASGAVARRDVYILAFSES